MHQNNGAVCKIAVHNSIIVGVRVQKLPVLRIKGPHKKRLLYNIINRLVSGTVRSAGHCRILSAGFHQSLVRLLILAADLLL